MKSNLLSSILNEALSLFEQITVQTNYPNCVTDLQWSYKWPINLGKFYHNLVKEHLIHV